jgi:urease accessory protein
MAPLGAAAPGLTRPAPPPPALARTGRDGLLRLRFERRGPDTVLAGCRSTLPLQVLAPVEVEDPAAIVSVLNPTGGHVGGDRLAIDVDLGAGAHACLTTPSATKVYRTRGDVVEQDIHLRVAAGAVLEWMPDHTIPFAGSALRQRIRVQLGEGARLILADAFAAGRVARGEAWQFAVLDNTITIGDPRGWLLYDRFVLSGDRPWTGLGLAEHYPYFATVVVIGDVDVADLSSAVTGTAAPPTDVVVGVGALARGGVVVRALAATAPALQAVLDRAWTLSRRALLGRLPPALRKG